ncbi:MAG: DUF2752 domain-containing protein [Chlorobi bacterium]|nr:DUF2752 domain-containing protein [Chlorobiota bacterium]
MSLAAKHKILKWGAVFGGLTLLVFIYKVYNPVENNFFPKCPFRELTGYKCPGCGSQRAVHHLLNFDIRDAMRENIMLVLSIPYLITGFIFDMLKNPGPKILLWRRRLFGTKAILFILAIIILFWICRNIPYCLSLAPGFN